MSQPPPRPTRRPQMAKPQVEEAADNNSKDDFDFSESNTPTSEPQTTEEAKAKPPPRPSKRPIRIQPADPDTPEVRAKSELQTKLEALDLKSEHEAPTAETIETFKAVQAKIDEEGIGGETATSLKLPGILNPRSAPEIVGNVAKAEKPVADTQPGKKESEPESEHKPEPESLIEAKEDAEYDSASKDSSEPASLAINEDNTDEVESPHAAENVDIKSSEPAEVEESKAEKPLNSEIDDRKTPEVESEPAVTVEDKQVPKDTSSNEDLKTEDKQTDSELSREDEIDTSSVHTDPLKIDKIQGDSKQEESSEPVENETKEVKPEDSKPEDSKPEDSKPEDSKPEDSKPEDSKLEESTSEAKPETKAEPEARAEVKPDPEAKDETTDSKPHEPVSKKPELAPKKPQLPVKPEIPAKPIFKTRGAFASRFEAALKEQEEANKPKPMLKPRTQPGKMSSRFTDLSEALSKGAMMPGERPRFNSQSSASSTNTTNTETEGDAKDANADADLETNSKAKPTENSEVEKDASPAAAESVDVQLKAMPANPRSRPGGPSRRRRLPESAKPKFSIVTMDKPLWELPQRQQSQKRSRVDSVYSEDEDPSVYSLENSTRETSEGATSPRTITSRSNNNLDSLAQLQRKISNPQSELRNKRSNSATSLDSNDSFQTMGSNTELNLRQLLEQALAEKEESPTIDIGHLDLPPLRSLVDQNPSPSAHDSADEVDPFSRVQVGGIIDKLAEEEQHMSAGGLSLASLVDKGNPNDPDSVRRKKFSIGETDNETETEPEQEHEEVKSLEEPHEEPRAELNTAEFTKDTPNPDNSSSKAEEPSSDANDESINET